ncbi:MAG: metallophosphoesterase, partial [Planctomycetes bacterium]|nr:metallophosphoesterase [Planctomycetota bacterium]
MTFDPQTISMQDAVSVSTLLDAAAERMLADPLRKGSSVFLPRRGRILLTGDLHDNPVHFMLVQQLAKLTASPDNHLVLHELIHGDRLVNGVDLSYRMLCRVAQLTLAFPGQVHVVLANHELAQVFRHPVSKGAGDNLELFDAGLDWAFGDDA